MGNHIDIFANIQRYHCFRYFAISYSKIGKYLIYVKMRIKGVGEGSCAYVVRFALHVGCGFVLLPTLVPTELHNSACYRISDIAAARLHIVSVLSHSVVTAAA